jgi:nicotinamide riboside kinase
MGFASPEVDKIGQESMADYYLVTKPDVAFVKDCVRNSEDQREWMHEEFVKQLEAKGARYGIISGPFETRFQQALDLIEKYR